MPKTSKGIYQQLQHHRQGSEDIRWSAFMLSNSRRGGAEGISVSLMPLFFLTRKK